MGDGDEFVVGETFERVWQDHHPQAGMSEMAGHLMSKAFEFSGDDHDGGLLQRFNGDGVVDTPRRARASIA